MSEQFAITVAQGNALQNMSNGELYAVYSNRVHSKAMRMCAKAMLRARAASDQAIVNVFKEGVTL